LFYLLLVFLLPYRIYGEIKLCKSVVIAIRFTVRDQIIIKCS